MLLCFSSFIVSHAQSTSSGLIYVGKNNQAALNRMPFGGCAANAGTATITVDGLPVSSPVLLCANSCISINSNNDYLLPVPVAGEVSELNYALYTGVPNTSIEPSLDPNFTGLFWTGKDFSDCNNASSILMSVGLGNHFWFVPLTMDDSDDNGNPNASIGYDNNSDACFALGTPIEFTFLTSISSNQNLTICAGASITIGTATHTTTGVFTDVLTAANGCDSTVTTNLTVSSAIVGSQTMTVCTGGSVTVGTTTHTTTGVFTDVLIAANSCDSTVTTNLTVEPAIDVAVTNASPVLTANQTGATYQWLDCNNSNQAIAGETNQNYTATVSGNYAVEITVGNCVDTSACETVTVTSISSISENAFAVYPNPSAGVFTMNLVSTSKIVITNALGQVVFEKELISGKQVIDLTNVVEGVYFVKVISGKQQGIQRIVISK
jgi:hypothetical protein